MEEEHTKYFRATLVGLENLKYLTRESLLYELFDLFEDRNKTTRVQIDWMTFHEEIEDWEWEALEQERRLVVEAATSKFRKQHVHILGHFQKVKKIKENTSSQSAGAIKW